MVIRRFAAKLSGPSNSYYQTMIVSERWSRLTVVTTSTVLIFRARRREEPTLYYQLEITQMLSSIHAGLVQVNIQTCRQSPRNHSFSRTERRILANVFW